MILLGLGVMYIYQENRGVSFARNLGASAATGESKRKRVPIRMERMNCLVPETSFRVAMTVSR